MQLCGILHVAKALLSVCSTFSFSCFASQNSCYFLYCLTNYVVMLLLSLGVNCFEAPDFAASNNQLIMLSLQKGFIINFKRLNMKLFIYGKRHEWPLWLSKRSRNFYFGNPWFSKIESIQHWDLGPGEQNGYRGVKWLTKTSLKLRKIDWYMFITHKKGYPLMEEV